jgi:hypothetical protein
MKKQNLIILITSLLLGACGDSGPTSSSPFIDPISNSGTDWPPGWEDGAATSHVPASACVSVSSEPFMRRVNGSWQRHQETNPQPFCTRDEATQQVARSFISFNSAQNTYHSLTIGYGPSPNGVLACINASVGVGTPLRPVDPMTVELCQTPELVSELGEGYYFQKTSFGLFRLVGTTQDTRGRVVLLISNLRSSSPDVSQWLESPQPFAPYVDHNDFRSVELR